MPEQLDCVVAAGGVFELPVGGSVAMAGREIIVLEAEPEVGIHTSSRNSEVIHAGLYFPQNSPKARLCVRGKEMLCRYCEERQVPFK